MTDTELRDEAVVALNKTEVSRATWEKNVTAGKYPDVAKTQWGIAFDRLSRIGGVVLPPPTGVAPPVPPSPYTVPAGALAVRTTVELVAALNGSAQNIVLEDGVYDNPRPIGVGSRHVYARNLGKAVVRFGIMSGGSTGGKIQGLTLDVPSNDRCSNERMVDVWSSSGFTALDLVLKGNKQVAHGLYFLSPNLADVQRIKAGGFTDTAVRLSTNHLGSNDRIQRVNDIDIDGVTRAIVNSSNGTAEAGLWVGEPVIEGVHRVRVRNVSWSGIEGVNNCNATAWTDLDVDMGGIVNGNRVAFYGEHFVKGGSIDRFIFTEAKYGFVGEWDDPVWGGLPAAVDFAIRNGIISRTRLGIYFDEGSGPGNSVTNVAFDDVIVAVGEYKPTAKATLKGLTYKDVATPYSTEHYGGLI